VKISYVNSVCVQYDAISNAIRNEIGWLQGSGHDVHLFAYACDFDCIPFTKVDRPRDVAFHEHFLTSDLVVFHFGIFSPLFDLLQIVPKRAKRLVVFHNITPKEFASEANHETIGKSFVQLSNLAWADRVLCDSTTNLRVLEEHGLRVSASVAPLCVDLPDKMPIAKPSFVDGQVRMLFIGRFVRAKGLGDLLEATEAVLQENTVTHLKVDLIGNISFSDLKTLEETRAAVETLAARFSKKLFIDVHGDATDCHKSKLLGEADIFVLPTYHEGFCVPIIEALAFGCRVIAYDNSNVPSISGGFADLAPTGNVRELTQSLLSCIARVRSAIWQTDSTDGYSAYCSRVAPHVETFAEAHVRARFLREVNALLVRQPSASTSL
jgi:glycosyltransferase involved in cell wall biosynthesis